ncbi:hypothetical protein FJTKL_00928 [Diaporthe vaccinii]|uniref:Uncharacterized protein n=1 Tax=Diaporthe vaccinii TaxID=105482 RepID=A0ABR4E1Y4_9PEZI
MKIFSRVPLKETSIRFSFLRRGFLKAGNNEITVRNAKSDLTVPCGAHSRETDQYCWAKPPGYRLTLRCRLKTREQQVKEVLQRFDSL